MGIENPEENGTGRIVHQFLIYARIPVKILCMIDTPHISGNAVAGNIRDARKVFICSRGIVSRPVDFKDQQIEAFGSAYRKSQAQKKRP